MTISASTHGRHRAIAAAAAAVLVGVGATGGWLATGGLGNGQRGAGSPVRLALRGSSVGAPGSTAAHRSTGGATGQAHTADHVHAHTASSTGAGAGAGSAHVPAALPPAPRGTIAHLDGLYAEIYRTLQATGVPQTQPGGTGGLPAPAAYDRLTASLTGHQRAVLYAATRHAVRWSTLAATYHHLASVAAANAVTGATGGSAAALRRAPSTAGTASSTTTNAATGSGTVAGTAHILGSGVATFPPTPPSGSFPLAPSPYTPTSPVGPATGIVGCPSPAPGADYGDAGIYGATIASDILGDAASYAPSSFTIEVTDFPVSIDVVTPNPVRVILAVATAAAQTAEAALQFEQAAWSNCTSANWGTYLANADNTTVNTYNLLLQLQATLGHVERSVTTLHGQVQTLQQTADAQLALGIEQALAAGPGTPPNAAYELPATLGGNLDSTPVGVQSVVTNAIAAAKQVGLPVNQAATRYLAMANAALSSGGYATAYTDYVNAYQQAAQ